MASRGGWKGGRLPSIARAIALTPANRKRLGTEAATIVRDRAFPSTGPGRDEDGKPYTPYSKRRLYVSKESPPRPADMPAPRGANRQQLAKAAKRKGTKDQTLARGETREIMRTVRYDGGYDQYRQSIGRSSGTNKNLVLTGQTARALNFLRSTTKSITIGFRTRRARAIVLDSQYNFMGLTREEERRATRIWRDLVVEQVREKLTGRKR